MTTSGRAGALIAGRYRLDRRTGGGTWPEELWQGFDETLSRPVMLRLLPVDERVGTDIEEQAHSVVAQVARLGHPNIAQVYDVGQQDALRYVVSEWTGGRTLGQIMATGRQRWQRAVDWGQQIAEALAALHSIGLVDGVLGPETVSVLDDRRVKLTDVGLGVAQDGGAREGGRPAGFLGPDEASTRVLPPGADARGEPDAPSEPGLPGGPDAEATRVVPPGGDEDATQLMPPGSDGDFDGADGGEPTRVAGQYPSRPSGRRLPAGAATDIYALGAILWTAMVGTPPHVEPTDLHGPDTAPLRDIGAPDELVRLLRSMLAASETVRPSAAVSANRFAALVIEGRERVDTLPTAALAQPTQVLADQQAARRPPAEPAAGRAAQRPAGHGRAWALAIGLVLLLGAAAAALALWLNHDRVTPPPVVPPATVTTPADQVTISAAPTTTPTTAPTATSAAPTTSSAAPSPSASPSPPPSPSAPASASAPPSTPATQTTSPPASSPAALPSPTH